MGLANVAIESDNKTSHPSQYVLELVPLWEVMVLVADTKSVLRNEFCSVSWIGRYYVLGLSIVLLL